MDRIQSGYKALQELVTIVIGVGIANIVTTTVGLMTGTVRSADPLTSVEYFFLGWSLVFLSIRFCHGNYRSMDEELSLTHLPRSDGSVDDPQGYRFAQILELLVVLTQGALIAAFGLLLPYKDFLWYGTVGLFFSDVLLAAIEWVARGFEKISPYKYVWFNVNAFSSFFLFVQWLYSLSFFWVLFIVVVGGTLVDYGKNYDFYFPRQADRRIP